MAGVKNTLHISDSHLQKSKYKNEKRALVHYGLLMKAIRKASELGCSDIIHTGDIFDSYNPGAVVISQIIEVDKYLKSQNMPMYVITGNHDMGNPRWLDLLFNGNKQSGIILVDEKFFRFGDNVLGYGISGGSFSQIREELGKLRNVETPPEAILIHTIFKEDLEIDTNEDRLKRDEAKIHCTEHVQYILTGDLHKHQAIHEGFHVFLNPGSTVMCSVAEEPEKSGFVLTSKDGHILGFKSETLFKENFFEFDLKKGEDLQVIKEELNKFSKEPTKDFLVRINYDIGVNYVDDLYKLIKQEEWDNVCIVPHSSAVDVSVVENRPIKDLSEVKLQDFVEGVVNNESIKSVCFDIVNSRENSESIVENYLAK